MSDYVSIKVAEYSTIFINVHDNGSISYSYDIETSVNPCSEIVLPNDDETKKIDDIKAMTSEERIRLYKSLKGINKFNL
jgi:ribosome recycling factor